MFSMLIPLAGCLLGPGGREPVWSITPERLDVSANSGRRPFAIPEIQLIVAVTLSRHMVAYDAATGAERWNSKVHVEYIQGHDASTITVGTGNGVVTVNAGTGEMIAQLTKENVPLVRFGEVQYGLKESRELAAWKNGQTWWTDPLGFIPGDYTFPELYHNVLIYRGVNNFVPIAFARFYAPDSGKLLWDVEAEGIGQPAALLVQWAGNRVVVLCEGELTSRELATGRVVWTGKSDRPPVVSATRVLAFEKNNALLRDASTGKQIATWKFTVGIGPDISSLSNGAVYTGHSQAVQTLGTVRYNFTLMALDEITGKVQWRSKMDKWTSYSEPMIFGDTVLIVSSDRVYATKK